jgi:hypothetical protein
LQRQHHHRCDVNIADRVRSIGARIDYKSCCALTTFPIVTIKSTYNIGAGALKCSGARTGGGYQGWKKG